MMTKKKTYILDTNIFLHEKNSLHCFGKNDIVLPLIVIEELDRQKTRNDIVGKNARCVIKEIENLRQQGDLSQGVLLKGGGTLKILSNSNISLISPQMDNRADNLIISFAHHLGYDNKNVILVSNDLNVRIKCNSFKIRSENFKNSGLKEDIDEVYQGIRFLNIEGNEIDKLYETGKLKLDSKKLDFDLLTNEFCVLKNASGSAIGRCTGNNEIELVNEIDHVYNLKAKNINQACALHLLNNPNINLVSLQGKAGSGKTILTLACALDLVVNKKKYDKLIVYRPTVPIDDGIGFLPGEMGAKLAPWFQAILDNFEVLCPNKDWESVFENLEKKKKIEFNAISFARGRSIRNAIVYLDEAQNLSTNQIKTLLSRLGNNSKAVICGDIDQIDTPNLDSVNNGFATVIEKFKGSKIFGHITLTSCIRSPLAELVAELL